MPKFTTTTRPDRKLTDFFNKRPKTGSCPGEPIYDLSSSSERQSIISVASDDVATPVAVSQSDRRTRGHDGIRRVYYRSRSDDTRGSSHPRRHPTASSSKLSETQMIPISDSSRVLKPANGASGASQKSATASQTPKNTKKRKQPITLISSEESDGPVYPSIHVLLSSRKCGPRDSATQHGVQKNEEGSNMLTRQFGSNIVLGKEKREIVPSSQEDEMELLIDDDHMGVDDLNTSKALFYSPLPTVSPSKARTDDIIARIRAKAEVDAAAEAEDDRRRSSLGLLDSDKSDLSSLSSLSSDEDDPELELQLSTFTKGHVVKPITSPLPGPWTRRSTRRQDGPAPNYAKKLELFREDTPPPTRTNSDVSKTLKTKVTVPEACPLDVLLKDRQREWARKARLETKRRGDVSSTFGFDMDLDASVLETPKRGGCQHAKTESPGSYSSSPRDGNSLQDVLMGTAAREELLGKESSEAVGKILDDDRKKKSIVDQKYVGVSFWRDDLMGDIDVTPPLVITDQSHPFLTALANAVNREDYKLASLLMDSGALALIPLPVGLMDWLFSTALSAANLDLSLSAYRALLGLHRNVYSSEMMTPTHLDSSRLLNTLFKLGMNTHVARLLGIDEEKQVDIVAMSQPAKRERVCRFLTMLEALGRFQRVDPMAIPSLVCALLLLSLDSSAVPELQQDAVSAIEAVLASPNVTRAIELDTCKFVLHVTKELGFQPDLQTQALALLPGCSSSSGRVRRWIAWAMLGGDMQGLQECADVPPIQTLVNLFSKSFPGNVKFEATVDTDYEQLGAQVNILSVAMTNVDEYVRLENGSSMTKELSEALDYINGKIMDSRAAHMDRTKAKEAINRLQKRLVYQRHATIETMRTKTGNMEQFLVPRSGLKRA